MAGELKTFFIAMSPVLELRGAIPIALHFYKLPVWSSFFFAVLGNLVPALLLLSFLEPTAMFLSRRSRVFNRFFVWLFEKTRKRHEKKFEKWEKFALLVLVAIPLPFTGAWTGSICAFLFNIRFRQAFPLISSGVFIAGIITLATLGVFQFI